MNCRTSLTWKQLKLATIWTWEWLPLLTIIPVTENSDIIFNSDMLYTLWYPLGRALWLLFLQIQLGMFNSSAGPAHWRVPQQKLKKSLVQTLHACPCPSCSFLSHPTFFSAWIMNCKWITVCLSGIKCVFSALTGRKKNNTLRDWDMHVPVKIGPYWISVGLEGNQGSSQWPTWFKPVLGWLWESWSHIHVVKSHDQKLIYLLARAPKLHRTKYIRLRQQKATWA